MQFYQNTGILLVRTSIIWLWLLKHDHLLRELKNKYDINSTTKIKIKIEKVNDYRRINLCKITYKCLFKFTGQ